MFNNDFNEDFNEEFSDFNEEFTPSFNIAPRTKKAKSNQFQGIDLPDGVNLDDFDIDTPPDLAGEIAAYMRNGAHREVKGGAYGLMAIQCIAGAAGSLRGIGNTKLSLITITLGVSAGGKERPQSVAKGLFDFSGVPVIGDIRSDKDVTRSVVRNKGRCVYVMDEAQKLLADSMSGQNKATQNVPAILMELITTDNFKLPEIHRDEFAARVQTTLGKLKKELDAKEMIKNGYHVDFEADKIKKIDLDIDKINVQIKEAEASLAMIESGIKNASVNLAAFSTPVKLAAIIDEQAIESGFLGRALIADCGAEAEELNRDLIDELMSGGGKITDKLKTQKSIIEQELSLIYQMSCEHSQIQVDTEFNGKSIFNIDADALELIKEIGYFYDERDEYRNHPRLGALYRRIMERLQALSSILALGSIYKTGCATVTREHVIYSLALILNSIAMLSSNLTINEGATSDRTEDKLEALKGAIIRVLTVSKSDKQSGWRYKTKTRDSIKRRKWYAEIEKEALSGGQCVFETSVMALIASGKIETSPCGKQIRLANN